MVGEQSFVPHQTEDPDLQSSWRYCTPKRDQNATSSRLLTATDVLITHIIPENTPLVPASVVCEINHWLCYKGFQINQIKGGGGSKPTWVCCLGWGRITNHWFCQSDGKPTVVVLFFSWEHLPCQEIQWKMQPGSTPPLHKPMVHRHTQTQNTTMVIAPSPRHGGMPRAENTTSNAPLTRLLEATNIACPNPQDSG